MGAELLSLGIKWPERKVHYLILPSAEVNYTWIYMSIPFTLTLRIA
jgi:hypothetical protein